MKGYSAGMNHSGCLGLSSVDPITGIDPYDYKINITESSDPTKAGIGVYELQIYLETVSVPGYPVDTPAPTEIPVEPYSYYMTLPTESDGSTRSVELLADYDHYGYSFSGGTNFDIYGYFIVRESSLPAHLYYYWGGRYHEYTYDGLGWDGSYWNYPCLDTGMLTIEWPVAAAYTRNKVQNKKWSVVAIDSTLSNGACMHSFFLSENGELYCCGGNAHGQLGIGEAMGYIIIDPTSLHTIPAYYTKTPIQVSGSWIDVACDSNTTHAIKSDGSLWVAGYSGGGIISLGSDDLNYFTLCGTDTWVALAAPGIGVQEVGDDYVIYNLSAMVVVLTIAKVDILPFTSVKDYLIYNLRGENYSFIGGSELDAESKPSGTLWTVQSAGTSVNEMSGVKWQVTTGYPIRSVESGPITDGQTIVFKSSTVPRIVQVTHEYYINRGIH